MKAYPYRLLLIAGILLLATSCRTLGTLREQNERIYLEEQLSGLEHLASETYPLGQRKTPYLLLSRKERSKASGLLSAAFHHGRERETIRLARLLGRGDLLIHLAGEGDTLLLAEGYLLSGNGVEAMRLLKGHDESPLYPFALLAMGDTLEAIPHLRRLALSKERVPGLDKRTVPETLIALEEPGSAGRRELLALRVRLAKNEVEKRFLSLREEIPESPHDRAGGYREETAALISGAFPEEAYDELALMLLPKLLEGEEIVSAYDLWRRLSPEARKVYPYSLFEILEREVEIVRVYEENRAQGEKLPIMVSEGTFRERYGSVARAPNWGMTYAHGSSSRTPGEAPTADDSHAPSEELYLATKQRIRLVLSGAK